MDPSNIDMRVDALDKMLASFMNVPKKMMKQEVVQTSHKELGGIWLVSARAHSAHELRVTAILQGDFYSSPFTLSMDGLTKLTGPLGTATARMWAIPYRLAAMCQTLVDQYYVSKGELRELIYKLTQIVDDKTSIPSMDVYVDYGGIIATVGRTVDPHFNAGRQLGRGDFYPLTTMDHIYMPTVVMPDAERVIRCIVP